MEDIKLSFVQRCVQQYADDVIAAMGRSITKNGAIDTGDLKSSIKNSVNASPSGATARILFNEYGRFIDMGVGNGHKLGSGVQALQSAILASSGATRIVKQPRKPRKIYSPIAYGKLQGLVEDIAYGFSNETIELIKKELEQQKTP